MEKQNWGEIHIRSYCQNEKKKKRVHQVVFVKMKRRKRGFIMSQLSKRGGCPTLPGQTGDWGGGGGDIGEAGDWQRIRGGQTSDRYCW